MLRGGNFQFPNVAASVALKECHVRSILKNKEMNNETRDLGMQFDDMTPSDLTQYIVDSNATNSCHQVSSIYSTQKHSTPSVVSS